MSVRRRVRRRPSASITGGTITVATAGTATLGIADIYSLEEALGPRFQPRAVFVGTNAIANKVYRMAGGGSTEPPVFNEDRTRILGKGYYELSTMDAATTSGKKVLIYGDIAAAYRMVDRIGLSVELIPYVFGASAHRPIGARGSMPTGGWTRRSRCRTRSAC